MRTRTLALPTAALLSAALAAGALAPAATSRVAVRPAAADCPAGMTPEPDVSLAAFAAGATAACAPALRPEPAAEVMAMNSQLALRRTSGYAVRAGALESATAQHSAIAAAGPSSAAAWVPVGRGPLNSDEPGFTSTNALGLHQLAGRIEDLAYDPASASRWYAAVANGGVWTTGDAGKSWRSVGDRLPTQITGAVDFLRPKKGSPTLLVGTGDPAFGGSSFSGQGVLWSANGGGRWTRAKGVPAGTLTFSFSHDKAKPSVVYAATSKGLYRSADYGHSFRNVGLPTTCTSTTNPLCFFANMVTDVSVRAANRDGKQGGGVLAVVGWRAGRKANAVGKPQSPRNGLYYSKTGAPGTFRWMSNAPGFAADNVVGRTALGAAVGPLQNHDYVYAVVQSAVKFNGGAATLDLPDAAGSQKIPNNTVLDGIYGSSDFGKTWTKMADAQQLQLPGTGTALVGANTPTYAPGVQSWYNEWISPDPTTQSEDGVPARLAFGLEEVWSGAGAIPLAPNTGRYKVVGRYFSGASCGGLNLGGLVGETEFYCPFADDPTKPQGVTTHPDQHAGLWVPRPGGGGVTLVVGNDGGAYKQALATGQDLDNDSWGKGINNGFNTLLPYDAAMASDGTTVMGLQDNGSAVIRPQDGKQVMAYGGDGFFVAIDPDNSNQWWEEYTGGGIRATTNGGKSWSTKNPGLSAALFATPFVMDPTSAKHLVIGGNEIAETTYGTSTQGPTNNQKPDINSPDPLVTRGWTKVYDLGTRTHPGDATASAAAGDPLNSMSAVDTRGDATYVAYCGYCDIVTQGVPFGSGIATNVGGKLAPKKMTSNGWHIAKAKGLPKRYVNSVRIDPANPRTIYVTLAGYGRRWIPPGSLGDDVSKIGRGHVFRSTDAGESFKDISGNLPDIGADDAFPFHGGLVVANDLGVYFGSTKGGTYRVLGANLPKAPVFRLNRSPRNSNELIAASYGRGVYRIVVAGAGTTTTRTPAGAGRSGSAALAGNGAAPGTDAAPGPVAEAREGQPQSVRATRASSDRAFYRSPAASVALLALLVLFVALGLRRRRASS